MVMDMDKGPLTDDELGVLLTISSQRLIPKDHVLVLRLMKERIDLHGQLDHMVGCLGAGLDALGCGDLSIAEDMIREVLDTARTKATP